MVQGQNSSGTLALTPAWFLEVEPNHLTPPPPSRPPARLIYCSQWTRRPLKRCKFAVFVKRKVREPGGGPPTPLSLRQHSPRLWLTNQSREAVGGVGVGSFGGRSATFLSPPQDSRWGQISDTARLDAAHPFPACVCLPAFVAPRGRDGEASLKYAQRRV